MSGSPPVHATPPWEHLPESLSWTDVPTPETFATLPGVPALYLLVDGNRQPVQLATTQQLRRQLITRLADPEERRPGRADLAAIVRGVHWRPLGTPFEGRWWYYRLARRMYPREYRDLVSFGPAWFLHVDWSQPVPEPRVSERVWCLPGEFLGPWLAHRACQAALDGLRDLFDLCRHPEQVRRTPRGTRCAYADMGRCDAPCDGSAPLPAYVARCRAAWAFAHGDTQAWLATAEQAMRQAAADQQYERAAHLKEQLVAGRRWPGEGGVHVGPAERLQYLAALPVTRRKAWKLLLFRAGDVADGPVVPARKLLASAAEWLAEQLCTPPAPRDDEVRMEQTWLLCHLLFSREAQSAVLVKLRPDMNSSEVQTAVAERVAELKQRPEVASADDAAASPEVAEARTEDSGREAHGDESGGARGV